MKRKGDHRLIERGSQKENKSTEHKDNVGPHHGRLRSEIYCGPG